MKTDQSPVSMPRCVVLGGFLGAGKTAAIARLSALLRAKHKIGIITNDEGTELVDTIQLRSLGFQVEEVSRGAFAAQPATFLQSAQRLVEARCDFIFAECSGTSADIRSSILQPLREKLGSRLSLAPLSVVVDALRASRMLRLQPGSNFTEKLNYIYRKQIEEAELLVINKCDLLPSAQLNTLRKTLAELAPNATLLNICTRNGSGYQEWLDCLLSREHAPAPIPHPVNHDLFSEAESLLGWLNCTIKVSSVRYFDAGHLLNNLATGIQSLLKQDAIEIAHLKLLLRAQNESTGATESAAINMVRNDLAPELSGEIHEPVQRAELTLNLRAEAKPEVLHTAVNNAILEIMEHAPDLFARMEHCEHFRLSRQFGAPPAASQPH